MEKIHLFENGLESEERFVLDFISTRVPKERTFIFEGMGGMADGDENITEG